MKDKLLPAIQEDLDALAPDILLSIPEYLHKSIFQAFARHRLATRTPSPDSGWNEAIEARGIYVASRASIPERSEMWRGLRDTGWPITSTWIDEAGEGETKCNTELWRRIQREIEASRALVLYVRSDDFPLKGALVEVGMALALGRPVYVVAPGVEMQPHTMRPLGSWSKHPNVTFCTNLDEARAAIRSLTRTSLPDYGDEISPEQHEAIRRLANVEPGAPLPCTGDEVERAIQKVEALQRGTRIVSSSEQEVRLDAEYDAGIRAAARCFRAALSAMSAAVPEEGISVFTIQVGGENSSLHVRAGKGVVPEQAIDAATEALRAERGDLEGCPYHAKDARSCTCHPDDRPEGPCRQKYAASECNATPSSAAVPETRPTPEGEGEESAVALLARHYRAFGCDDNADGLEEDGPHGPEEEAAIAAIAEALSPTKEPRHD